MSVTFVIISAAEWFDKNLGRKENCKGTVEAAEGSLFGWFFSPPPPHPHTQFLSDRSKISVLKVFEVVLT